MAHDVQWSLSLSGEEHQELERRYAESKKEYPHLTMNGFITWGVRYWLQQMQVMEKQREEEKDDGE